MVGSEYVDCVDCGFGITRAIVCYWRLERRSNLRIWWPLCRECRDDAREKPQRPRCVIVSNSREVPDEVLA